MVFLRCLFAVISWHLGCPLVPYFSLSVNSISQIVQAYFLDIFLLLCLGCLKQGSINVVSQMLVSGY